MKQTLHIILEDVEFFDTLDAEKAEDLAKRTDGEVYSWKTIGRSNWLERGYRRVDVLGLVVLPGRLPDSIDMSDDPEEEGVSFP
jgi:hypothetical protein